MGSAETLPHPAMTRARSQSSERSTSSASSADTENTVPYNLAWLARPEEAAFPDAHSTSSASSANSANSARSASASPSWTPRARSTSPRSSESSAGRNARLPLGDTSTEHDLLEDPRRLHAYADATTSDRAKNEAIRALVRVAKDRFQGGVRGAGGGSNFELLLDIARHATFAYRGVDDLLGVLRQAGLTRDDVDDHGLYAILDLSYSRPEVYLLLRTIASPVRRHSRTA